MPTLDVGGARWHKSSYSTDVSNCVEVAFVKSSHSTDKANCVEVALGPTTVAVRDSTAPGAGTLAFPPRAWAAFLATLRTGGAGG